jgi:hypothetical protein
MLKKNIASIRKEKTILGEINLKSHQNQLSKF